MQLLSIFGRPRQEQTHDLHGLSNNNNNNNNSLHSMTIKVDRYLRMHRFLGGKDKKQTHDLQNFFSWSPQLEEEQELVAFLDLSASP